VKGVRGVNGGYSLADSAQDLKSGNDRRRPFDAIEPRLQGHTLDEFHHKVLRALVLAERVNLEDVGVAHPRHGLRLGHESLSKPAIAQGVVNELDRDAAIQRLVIREQHSPHGPATEMADDAIDAADDGPDGKAATARGCLCISHAGCR
jgi:hypothetical protein